MSADEFLTDLKDQDEPKTSAKPKTRAGTKHAKMIDLMKRLEGATVERSPRLPTGSTTPSVAPSQAPLR